MRCRGASIGFAREGPLAREADTAQEIGRSIGAPPQPAISAVEGVVILAGLGRPAPDAAFAATHFEDARRRLRNGNAPIEAVATEIHQPAAGLGVALQGVERALRVVLRMRARDDDLVGCEQRLA